MTSRLKRKLGDIGVDTSSTRANENFCLIGTPLPPLEKSRDTGEFVPLWKQEVRDEKGRRRLHGAFTGGFSAGYFNTVGSKEGWTPQSFVSSRSDRAKQKQARPEDFMDEEDMQELADSRKIVDTTDEMDLAGEGRMEGQDDEQIDPLTAALQSAMLPPTKDSVGARILKKMGWRVGQGIGPRITFKQRRLQDLQASVGSGQTLPSDIPDDDPEEASKHTYAPRDTPILVVERKDNTHGIGYRPGMSLNESLGAKGAGKNSGPNLSAGFGLGALNDADEDDLDVYDGGSSSLRNRLAYDAADDHDGDRISLGGSKHKSNLSTPAASSRGTFRDGTAVLPGFFLSGEPVMEDRWYPLPEIPAGWKPDPKRVWVQNQTQPSDSANKENLNQAATAASEPMPHSKWKTRGLSADERGTLLGETPLPSAPRSVFDYMSQKDKDRLKNIAENLRSGSKPGESSSTANETPTPTPAPTPRIPHTDPYIARAALSGFQPFTTNPVKQARYTAYLQSQAQANTADPDSALSLEPLPHQSIAEFNSEMEEYAQSAVVFKPMSGAMAGRFTRSAVVEQGPDVVEGLHTPSFSSDKEKGKGASASSSAGGITFVDGDGNAVPEKEAQDKAEKEKDERKDLSPMENAARLGMYGPMTRETKPWQPARLLCKRFGVKDPSAEVKNDLDISQPPSQGPPKTSTSSAAAASFAASTFDPSSASGADLEKFGISVGGAGTGFPAGSAGNGRGGGGGGGRPRDLTNIGLGDEDDTQGQDTLTYERPSVDVFKAIFASDDEDSDDEEQKEEGAGDDDNVNQGSTAAPNPIAPTPVDPTGSFNTLSSSAAPAAAATSINKPVPIDLNTFKPTFVRREKDSNNSESKDRDEKKKDKEKKDKKKEKRKAIVSFMDDEGDGGESLNVVVEKPKKKKRKKDKDKDKDKDEESKDKEKRRREKEEDDMDMWVEKPPATGVQGANADVEMRSAVAGEAPGPTGSTVSKGRKRAIDFM
ncbi:hypothetical protein GYMLUDRAFT_51406 [Collybiopsis luxurians FD-317 M1]|uniref:G-patch domain-containing protein n=1 Tax=Collybiopsis luxurians FD-317 M1 TaxID=944289 RepID=A0A0D0C5U2_9AGAR|nr:hypothetical protein GYMLUDRAFT_51406 [Collybiopsis luxurians FD-317 M1]